MQANVGAETAIRLQASSHSDSRAALADTGAQEVSPLTRYEPFFLQFEMRFRNPYVAARTPPKSCTHCSSAIGVRLSRNHGDVEIHPSTVKGNTIMEDRE